MKVRKKLTEKNYDGNNNREYAIRGFKRHVPGAVFVAVADVLFFVLLMRWFFFKKPETNMKLEVRVLETEQNNCRNAHCKYAIRGFDRHLPCDVSVSVAAVLFFVLLLRWLFENERNMKIKLKVSRECTEQKNSRSADCEYAIRLPNGTHPLMLLLLLFSFLFYFFGDSLNKTVTLNF